MSGHEVTYARVRAVLWELASAPRSGNGQALPDVVSALLDFGSETPDNLAMATELNVATADGVGLGLRRSGVRLSRLIAAAVGSDVPEELAEEYAEIGRTEWTAALRIALAVLEALEPSDDPARQGLRTALWQIGDRPELSNDQLRDAVSASIVACHPSNPEFVEAAGRLDVRANEDFGSRSIGLCLTDSGALLSDLFWMASESPLPDTVAAEFPGLEQSEWEAAMLAVKLELIALETESEPLDQGA